MAFDLASYAKPLSREDALKKGYLVDCTTSAAWVGFRTPAAMSQAAWEECIGHYGIPTRAERETAGARLHQVWHEAQKALAAYKRSGVILPSIEFTAMRFDGKRKVTLLLSAGFGADRRPHVTITLGE